MKGGIGLATAIRTLTIFRVWGKESEKITTSLYWFVPVGLFLGILQWGLYVLLYTIASPFVIAALIVTFQIYISRAFHLDGLADMADGFGGGWTKERVLSIMKDSRIGAFGAISVSLLLIVKVAALTEVVKQSNGIYLIGIISISRFVLVFLSVTQRYARKEGGTAGELINSSSPRHLVVALAQIILIIVLFGKEGIFPMLSFFVGAIVMALYIAHKGEKNIEGITGDLLGSACELSEAIMLIIASLWL